MKDLRFGIEIETVGASKDKMANAIQSAVGGQIRIIPDSRGTGWLITDTRGRGWKVLNDGSLSHPSGHSGEVVSPILEYSDIETLKNVVRALDRAGAKTNNTCGIHIHVGVAGLGVNDLVNLAKLVHQQEELISAALGIQPARHQRYTKKLPTTFVAKLDSRKPRSMDELNMAWYDSRYPRPGLRMDDSRYHGLNMNSVWFRGTTEFRWFESTLHPDKVQAYIQFCLALVAKARSNKSSVSRKRAFAPATSRYDFRVFLLRLGLIGAEFKAARKHLLERLGGSSAWKHTRPRNGSMPTPASTPTTEEVG